MKLFDRLIDHTVDRVMARVKHNQPAGPTTSMTVNNSYRGRGVASAMAIADGIVKRAAEQNITYGVHGAAVAAQALSDQLENQKRHGQPS